MTTQLLLMDLEARGWNPGRVRDFCYDSSQCHTPPFKRACASRTAPNTHWQGSDSRILGEKLAKLGQSRLSCL